LVVGLATKPWTLAANASAGLECAYGTPGSQSEIS
jgi:hypothetical protein